MSPGRWTASPALSRPLAILGVERTFFVLSASGSAALFQATKTLLPPLVLFVVLYLAGRWAMSVDPRLIQIVAQARRYTPRYDPGKPPPP